MPPGRDVFRSRVPSGMLCTSRSPRPRPRARQVSGGGYRATTLALGWLRALHELGALDKARYISSNSGGSWINGAYSYTQVGGASAHAAPPRARRRRAVLSKQPHARALGGAGARVAPWPGRAPPARLGAWHSEGGSLEAAIAHAVAAAD